VSNIKVLNLIFGLNAVVVEKQFANKITMGTEDGDSEMTLFEFKGGEVSKIFEN